MQLKYAAILCLSMTVLVSSQSTPSTCTERWQCTSYSNDYNYVDCIQGHCQCVEGFEGSATSQDKCSCSGNVFYESGVARCSNPNGQVNCTARWQCSSVSNDYNYVDCLQGKCECVEGFNGTATAQDKCRCDKEGVYWSSGHPFCLSSGQCVADYTGPNCNAPCMNIVNSVGTCSQQAPPQSIQQTTQQPIQQTTQQPIQQTTQQPIQQTTQQPIQQTTQQPIQQTTQQPIQQTTQQRTLQPTQQTTQQRPTQQTTQHTTQAPPHTTCSNDDQCSRYSTDCSFVRCVDGSCQCRSGFQGSAIDSDKCRCNYNVYYRNGAPTCQTPNHDGSIPCNERWQCVGVSKDYNYIDCLNGVCTCARTFNGTATENDKCRCDRAGVYWNNGSPFCLSSGQCLFDYYGPNCNGTCVNSTNSIGTCA